MTLSIRWKVALGSLLAVTCGLAVAGLLAMQSLEQQEIAELNDMLDARTNLVEYSLRPALTTPPSPEQQAGLREIVRQLGARALARVTVITTNGTVIADSAVDDAGLPAVENHLEPVADGSNDLLEHVERRRREIELSAAMVRHHGRGCTDTDFPRTQPIPKKVALNKRFETIGWGIFLIILGGFMFIPKTTVSAGLWSIGIGLIFLGLNAARYMNGIRMSGFTTFLGIISVIGGIAQLLGWHTLDDAFFLIILGSYLILRPWFHKRQLFGKAEVGKEE